VKTYYLNILNELQIYNMTFRYNEVEIKLIEHAGFVIENKENKIIIDPYKTEYKEKGNIILITHDHFDHLDLKDLKKVTNTNSIVIAPTHCKKQLEKLKVKKIIELNAGKDTEINGVEIKAVVSYNINKFNDVGELCHTKKYGGVGYIITIDKTKIYNLGDTDNINEFDNIEKNIDIALVPVSGTYVMTANEAAEAVNRIRPKIAIPTHYNSIVGSTNDAREFKNLARCNVKILRPYE